MPQHSGSASRTCRHTLTAAAVHNLATLLFMPDVCLVPQTFVSCLHSQVSFTRDTTPSLGRPIALTCYQDDVVDEVCVDTLLHLEQRQHSLRT